MLWVRQGRLWSLLVVSFSAASLVFAGAGATGSPPPGAIFRTSGTITAIAADGNRVAAAATTGTSGSCDQVVVWTAATPSSTSYTTEVCSGEGGAQELREVALAGTRVAWVEMLAGNRQELTLKIATAGQTTPTTVDYAENGSGAEGDPDGGYLGHLFGDGALLVYDTWQVCTALPTGWESDSPHCEDVAAAGGPRPVPLVRQQRLLRIQGTKPVVLGDLPAAARVVAVDAGRIAVLEESGSVNVTLFSASGTSLRRILISGGPFAGVALSGAQLLMLHNGSLELYDTAMGAHLRTIALPPGKPAPELRDLESGLAVYVRGTTVHVVRVSDGKELRIAAGGEAPVDAQLEGPGLFYSYNLPRASAHGRIVFLPFSELAKGLR
jgi:hypothetical protein